MAKDKCDLDLSKEVEAVAKELNRYFSRGHALLHGKRTIVRDVVNKARAQLKEIQDIIKLDPEGVDVDKVTRSVQRVIANTKLDYNINTAAYQKMRAIASELTGNPKREMEGIIAEFLNQLAESKKASEKEFTNLMDKALENMKTGGKKITEEQANSAKKLMLKIAAEGDEAALKYLATKGVTTEHAGLLVQGMRQGHITDAQNLTELDLVFRTLKEVENEIQTVVEKKLPGYKRLQDHAFVATFDNYKIGDMTRKDFILKAYDGDKFIFDLSHRTAYKNLDAAGKRSYEEKYLADLYDNITTKTAADTLERPSTIGGVFQDRNIKFADDASEMVFFKNFGQDEDGLIRGRLNHLYKQLTDINTRDITGSNPDLWFANLENAAVEATRGKLSTEKLNRVFRGRRGDFQHAIGKYAPMGEEMSAIHEITHNNLQALLTVFSGARQMVLDGTLFSAIVNRSFDKNTGLITGWGAHTKELLTYMAKYAANDQATLKMTQLLEDQQLSILMSRADVIRRLHSPSTAMFSSGKKGWVGGLIKFSEWNANVVSKYGLADASYKATRLKGAINAGQHIRKIKDFLDKDSAFFLKRYGFDNDQWKELSSHLEMIKFQGKDIMYDTNKGFNNVPDEILRKYAQGLEKSEDVIRRLNNQLRYMHQDTVNEFASVPTLKTGIPIHTAHDSGHTRFFLGLIYKFMGIHLSQNQTMSRAIKRINGVHNFDEGIFGIGVGNPINMLGVGLKSENLAVNLELMALLAASGYGIEATRALMDGKTPPPFTPHTIWKSVMNTGVTGFAGNLAQSFYYGNDIIGTPLSRYGYTGGSVAKGIGKAAVKGDPDLLYRSLIRGVNVAVPASSLIFRNNSAQEYHIREWLGLSNRSIKQGLKRDEQSLLFKK